MNNNLRSYVLRDCVAEAPENLVFAEMKTYHRFGLPNSAAEDWVTPLILSKKWDLLNSPEGMASIPLNDYITNQTFLHVTKGEAFFESLPRFFQNLFQKKCGTLSLAAVVELVGNNQFQGLPKTIQQAAIRRLAKRGYLPAFIHANLYAVAQNGNPKNQQGLAIVPYVTPKKLLNRYTILANTTESEETIIRWVVRPQQYGYSGTDERDGRNPPPEVMAKYQQLKTQFFAELATQKLKTAIRAAKTK